MSKPDTWLLDHQASVFSQSGEDGVIEKILNTLPSRDNWCVEFGALDGKHLSNTRNLIDNKNYSAVLIEASAQHYKKLKKNYSPNKNVTLFNKFVGFKNDDNLDYILKNIDIPLDFDFLSIDIDGNDYHAWNAITNHSPKVICIEFNQTIPNEVEFVQQADPEVSQGSSLSAMVNLGKKKGYELVCVISVNAFFVQKKYFHLFEINNNTPENLRTDTSQITHLFVGYDGTLFMQGPAKLPWHAGIPLAQSKIQPLPRFLRKFPGNYNKPSLALFGLYLLVFHPNLFIKALKKKYRSN